MGKPRNLGEQIKQLRTDGIGFNEIVNRLKCSKSTVHYHISSKARKMVYTRTKRQRSKNPLLQKIHRFQAAALNSDNRKAVININKALYTKVRDFCKNLKTRKSIMSFSIDDVKNKIGENPTCYLTGKPIDLSKPRTYHLDHMTPRSRGGSNTLDNLGICTKRANMAKSDMTVDEFYDFCETVIKHKNKAIS